MNIPTLPSSEAPENAHRNPLNTLRKVVMATVLALSENASAATTTIDANESGPGPYAALNSGPVSGGNVRTSSDTYTFTIPASNDGNPIFVHSGPFTLRVEGDSLDTYQPVGNVTEMKDLIYYIAINGGAEVAINPQFSPISFANINNINERPTSGTDGFFGYTNSSDPDTATLNGFKRIPGFQTMMPSSGGTMSVRFEMTVENSTNNPAAGMPVYITNDIPDETINTATGSYQGSPDVSDFDNDGNTTELLVNPIGKPYPTQFTLSYTTNPLGKIIPSTDNGGTTLTLTYQPDPSNTVTPAQIGLLLRETMDLQTYSPVAAGDFPFSPTTHQYSEAISGGQKFFRVETPLAAKKGKLVE